MGPEADFVSASVQKVVNDLLCVHCGICVTICPSRAITMRETPAGLLVASVSEEKCNGCGHCLAVCPGRGFNLPDLGGLDPFRGPVLNAYVGHAAEATIRASAQSGGIASALLIFLLESGRIDGALVTPMPKDGSLRPRPALARSREEILAAQGSKYCPTAPGVLLDQFNSPERLALVGIPCQMQGFHKWASQGHPSAAMIQYRIGLVCDRMMASLGIDLMVRNAGLQSEALVGVEYRSKARNGWPGEVCFHTGSGQRLFFPSALRTNLKEFLTPLRCRLCFDKMNFLSDLSVGDAWGISSSLLGESAILVRNQKGADIVREAVAAGYLEASEIDPERIFKGQGVEKKRRNFFSFMRLCRQRGLPLPEYEGLPAASPIAGDQEIDADNQLKLAFSLSMAASATRRDALALARAWQCRQRRKVLVSSLAQKMATIIRALLFRKGR